MNRANVEALRDAILAAQHDAVDPGFEVGWAPMPENVAWWWARELAARGVLVPAALTDGDGALNAFDLYYSGQPLPEVYAALRAELERIAKGEPA